MIFSLNRLKDQVSGVSVQFFAVFIYVPTQTTGTGKNLPEMESFKSGPPFCCADKSAPASPQVLMTFLLGANGQRAESRVTHAFPGLRSIVRQNDEKSYL